MLDMPPSCDMKRRSQESSSIAQPPKFLRRFRAPLAILTLQNYLLPRIIAEDFGLTDIPIGYHKGFNLVTWCNELLTVAIGETDTLW